MKMTEPSEQDLVFLIPRLLNDLPIGPDDKVSFQFDVYSDTLARIIASPATSTPMALWLQGGWGSGKTSLMHLIRQKLRSLPKKDEQSATVVNRQCSTVWFNAWKYSRSEHLFVALTEAILGEIKQQGLVEKLRAVWEDPKRAEFHVLPAILKGLLQGLTMGAVDVDIEEYRHESAFRRHLPFFDDFDRFFDELVAWYSGAGKTSEGLIDDSQGVVVIFIDDLDRCLPHRIVSLLETMKLFMDKQGCVFVIAADTVVISAAVQAHYARHNLPVIDGREYLKKLMQARFELPPIRMADMEAFISEDLALEGVLRDSLRAVARYVPTNPREIKSFVNHVETQWAMAVNTGVGANLTKDLIIKWLLLDTVSPQFCDTLRNIDSDLLRARVFREMQQITAALGCGEDATDLIESSPLPNARKFSENQLLVRLFQEVMQGFDSSDVGCFIHFTGPPIWGREREAEALATVIRTVRQEPEVEGTEWWEERRRRYRPR